MKKPSVHAIGFCAIITLIVLAVFSISERNCVCTSGEGCFCPEDGTDLHDVTNEEMQSLSPTDQDRYRAFLTAWEGEYERQNQEWVRMLIDFSTEDHSEDERREFHRTLEKQRRDYYLLFRYRNSLFRTSVGLP